MSGTECGSDSSSGAGIGKIFAANKDEEELKSDGRSGGEGDHRQHCIIILKLMLPNSNYFPQGSSLEFIVLIMPNCNFQVEFQWFQAM